MTKLSCLNHVKRDKSGKRPNISGQYVISTFIADRSGSMISMSEQLRKGIIDYTRDQRDIAKNSNVNYTLIAFDNEVLIPFQGNPVNLTNTDINNLAIEIYPRGSTALYDSIYNAIIQQNKIEKDILKNMTPIEKNLFKKLDMKIVKALAVFTDGEDNCSEISEFLMKDVVINHRKSGATCIFLGANFDTKLASRKFGFDENTTLQVTSYGKYATAGLNLMRQCMTRATSGDIPRISRLERQTTVDANDAVLYNVNSQQNNTINSIPPRMPLKRH